MRRFAIVILLVALALPALAADDPWVGRSRDEVLVALGEPAKAKLAKDGSGRLVYKFHQLREGSVPGPRMIPVAVDGVGTVFRVLPREAGDVQFEPTTIDGNGAPIVGGTRTNEGGGASYHPDTGKFETKWDPDDNVDVTGKVKLTFELGTDGRVVTWAVSPTSARQESASP